jgi:hypothetical protein
VAVVSVFALLVAAWGIGVWGTMVRGTTYDIVGTYVARPTPTTIIVRHEAVPQLDMLAMELMTFELDPAVPIDEARLEIGARVRLRVRQRADGLTVIALSRAP